VLVQNWLTGGFNRFSAMTVIDRQNQEAVLGEQKLSASGAYSEADYIRIGNLTNTRYVVGGTLIRVSASQFSLQLAVTDAETGVRLPGAASARTSGATSRPGGNGSASSRSAPPFTGTTSPSR
jgi:TolB-like protein